MILVKTSKSFHKVINSVLLTCITVFPLFEFYFKVSDDILKCTFYVLSPIIIFLIGLRIIVNYHKKYGEIIFHNDKLEIIEKKGEYRFINFKDMSSIEFYLQPFTHSKRFIIEDKRGYNKFQFKRDNKEYKYNFLISDYEDMKGLKKEIKKITKDVSIHFDINCSKKQRDLFSGY